MKTNVTRRDWLRSAAGMLVGLPTLGSAWVMEASADTTIAPADTEVSLHLKRDAVRETFPPERLQELMNYDLRSVSSEADAYTFNVVSIDSAVSDLSGLQAGDTCIGANGTPLTADMVLNLSTYIREKRPTAATITLHVQRGDLRIDYRLNYS